MRASHLALILAIFALIATRTTSESWKTNRGRGNRRTNPVRSGATQRPPVLTNANIARSAATAKERQLVDTVSRLTAEFVDHLKQNHADNIMARDLVANWTGDVQILISSRLPLGRVGATYDRTRGRMYVNPDTRDNFVPDRLNSKILHELAHCRGMAHNYEWSDTWKYYLRIASEELGWKCAIRQEACAKYALCLIEECPQCAWVDQI